MFLAYPYTDLYNLNLDWMIKAIKEVQEVIENLGSVVNTFNEREGDVVLTSEDVNSLEIDSVVTLPEGSFDTITEAQKTAYYEAGKRIIVALNTYGDYSRLGFLYKAGSAVGMAEYVPTQEEHAVLSFNGRTGRVTLNDSDVNNLQIRPVLQLNGSDVSSLTTAQKLQYFDAGIRFVHCVPTQGGTLTTQKLYTLTVNESGGTRIPYVTAYDPLQGQGLVKAVNSESPNTSGQLYLYADDITMANDDNDTVYDRIRDLESAAVTSVNGATPTQGAVEITGGDIQVAADDDTTLDVFASDVYSELEDRVKSVNGVTPTSGAVSLTGADIAVSASDATKINVKLESLMSKVVNNVEYIQGVLSVADSAASPLQPPDLITAVWNALNPTYPTNYFMDVRSYNVSRYRLMWGFKTSTGNGMLYLQDFLTGNAGGYQTLYKLTASNNVLKVTMLPDIDSLAVVELNNRSGATHSAGDFIATPSGFVRAKTDIAADINLISSTDTEKFANGILNAMQYEELVLSETDFISGTITSANFQMSLFRFGPLKLIKGRITFVGFDSSLTYVDVLNIPSRFRPENSTVVIATTGVNTPINIAVSLTPSVLRIYKNPDVQEMTNFPIRFMCVYF